MATLQTTDNSQMIRIKRFMGLNENADGDTAIKIGEFSSMRNFRITKDGHLQIRQGTDAINCFDAESTVYGYYCGMVNGRKTILANVDGNILQLFPISENPPIIGNAEHEHTLFFGYDDKVYLIDGTHYLSWDGDVNHTFTEVSGYVPLIQIATTPIGVGELLENVNRLTPRRRVQFSPDGSSVKFHLPEKPISSIAKVTVNGATVSNYTVDASNGTFTFQSAPNSGVNTVECEYIVQNQFRGDVLKMRYVEFYNGATDTRIFLYGDGSNKCIYSGLDTNGISRADYFPDLYEIAVGEDNTPLTGLVRHYNRMMAYKTNSAYSISYATTSIGDGIVLPGFHCVPVNRQFGNDAFGQVILLQNNPITFDANNVYQWSTSQYSYANISNNENNAKRISDRIEHSLTMFDFDKINVANIKSLQEYWVIQNGNALVLNYSTDAWYFYNHLPFKYICEIDGDVYGIGDNGFVHFSRRYRHDVVFVDGTSEITEIDAYAESGSMAFDHNWLKKYSPMLFVTMKPESSSRINVTVSSNRKSNYPTKSVAYSLANFDHVDYEHFSFGTNYAPQTRRLKIKVKKATFYQLIFYSKSSNATATIIETDIQVRLAGKVK